ncbi:MAG: ligase-associated DNA damage response endonuclease PdeM [Gemmatimonadota bacterium]|nr:ligase-associated DNA damage response endonuclease PdeM [Gemmatimonadota bacterium]
MIAGDELILSPERAAFWVRRSTLLIADPHFGKAAAFRALGVRAPAGTTAESVTRMDRLVATHAPERIVFLGDFLHAREGRNAATFSALAEWREKHGAIEMCLVRGNHDRRAGDPPPEVNITCVDAPLQDAPFALAHHPVVTPGSYTLAGHIHPCAVLTGLARQRERLPCFWFGRETGVLPAFGEFTGCAEVEAEETDELWVVANDEVCRVNRS